jgi:hypothetical protein
MNDADDKEYLKGKIRGLEMVRDVLIDALVGNMPDITADIELRVLLRDSFTRIATDDLTVRVVETPFGKGVQDALAESGLKFLDE